ncbi:butyrophilin subfamily 1 member A1-like isoform X2 [Rhinatrema bivittatum]|uniref:butyrophilin subfamily 1 member A1-like isoform X2 n=1 Tax=Rhinatrema bivittatum TaxID=194408 RepID=UPI00112774EB|nr:butyrophilin subfamily 1 member A1-like isoform X2 [Rhinatrema bivittatum]
MRSSLSWPVVIIPFVLLHVHVTDSVERFSVVGLEQPLIAAIGEDAVLPCHLSPAVSAHDMEVRWFRSKFHAVVHLYRNGTDENDQQMPDFQGRTEFMKEDIGRGRVALRIRRIRLSDEGLYRCFFERGSTYDEAILELKTAEPFFPRVSPWIVAFAITSLLFLGLTALAVWYNMKQRRQRGMLSRSRERLFNEVVWRRGVMNPEPVTLDPRTANPELIVSEDRKTASRSDVRQNLPDDEERFDTEYCVLGQHAFSHGRHYWEVEVGDGPEWAVGVARESVRRRGAYMFSPEEAIWCVSLFVDRYQVLTNPETSLELANRPRKLGVFLDFESGQLSFFNGEDRSLIYSFPEIFSGRILPFFWIGRTGTEIRLCH